MTAGQVALLRMDTALELAQHALTEAQVIFDVETKTSAECRTRTGADMRDEISRINEQVANIRRVLQNGACR